MTDLRAALEGLYRISNELCDAVDSAAHDIGGHRSINAILADLGPATDTARAALAARPAEAAKGWEVPEGWALVPVESTDEMCEAAWDSDAADYVGEHKRIHSLSQAWIAMLSAAPSPPANGEAK